MTLRKPVLLAVPVLIGVYVLSYMMVSTITFPSFKHIEYIKAHPFQLLVAGLLLLVVVASAPEIMIFVMTMIFVIGGTLWDVVRLMRNRAHTRSAMQAKEQTNVE